MRRRLDIRYARLGTENALSAVPTSFPILIGKKIDHLDVQVYVQIRVTRHPSLPHMIFTPFPDEVAHKTSSLHNTEKPVIANHFEIGLISLGITVVVE